jgi:ADP-ribosyl-[dinitrogen reductase] hydrolase
MAFGWWNKFLSSSSNEIMTRNANPSRRERILGGLWGAVVGDALGVPVEFKSRDEIQTDLVTDMKGNGTHRQPAGTWSDDSSLLLCTADSLVCHDFNTEDMGKRFVGWYQEKVWTPWGKVFDVGLTTSRALARIANGVRAEVAGEDGQHSNGNGSLMRILPVAFRFAEQPLPVLLDHVHRASAITHRHPRSQLACGFYALVTRELLAGVKPTDAFERAIHGFRRFYEPDPYWAAELDHFQLLLAGDLGTRPESEIDSSGYVVHTLTASLWCLLTTHNYGECVLRAVNLCDDTDTTGCVAGGVAGIAYGVQAVPHNWIGQLARQPELEELFNRFSDLK